MEELYHLILQYIIDIKMFLSEPVLPIGVKQWTKVFVQHMLFQGFPGLTKLCIVSGTSSRTSTESSAPSRLTRSVSQSVMIFRLYKERA